jgi:hypothetical protein
LEIADSNWKNQGYDYTQRAYVLVSEASSKTLEMTLQASEKSPLVNPAFVMKNWNANNFSLEIDGNPVAEGKEFRYGVEYDVNGKPMVVVWIKYSSAKQVKIVLKS